MTIRSWLAQLGDKRFADVLEQNDIAPDLLRELGELALAKIGVGSLSAHREIIAALAAGPAGMPSSAPQAPTPCTASVAAPPGMPSFWLDGTFIAAK